MPTSTTPLGDVTITEIAEMLEDTSSSLHVRFNALVSDVSNLLLQQDEKPSAHRLKTESVKMRSIDGVTGELEFKAYIDFALKLSPGIVAVLPHTKQLGVRSNIDGGEQSFFSISPSDYLLAIAEAGTNGAYSRLVETINALEAELEG